MANVLEVRKLTKKYGEKAVVREVDLSIAKGECLALLGPNGAGKSTLCEMLSGLLSKDSGEIEILGGFLPQDREKILQRIGVQLQHTDLYGRYTVRETLQLFASFYERCRTVEETLAAVDLSAQADTMLRKLSGGQKQRVFLGCCLIHDPDLLFLDEPSTGLDPQARRTIWDTVLRLKKEGRSMLLTTHFMDEAECLADRIAVMDQGSVVAVGTAAELKAKFCPGEMVNLTLGEVPPPKLREELAALFDFRAAKQDAEAPVVFSARVASFSALLVRLTQWLSSHGMSIQELEVRKTTLEDVFLMITGRAMNGV